MSIFKVIFIIVGAFVIISGSYFLTLLGPKDIDYNAYEISHIKNPEELLKQSQELEAEFEKDIVATANISPESIAKLEEAVKLQELYIDRVVGGGRLPAERLLALKRRLHDILAEPISKEIEEIEKKAVYEAEFGDIQRAKDLYNEAYEKQDYINSNYAMGKYKDVRKAVMYNSQVKTLEVRPIYMESLEYEKQALEALEANDWNKAELSLSKTIEILVNMFNNYPTSVYTDYARLKKLEVDLDSLKSANLMQEVKENVSKAQKAKEEENYMQAAEHYSDASDLQKKLNEIFPNSKHSSVEYMQELALNHKKALSWNYVKDVEIHQEKLNEALIAGNYSQVKSIIFNLISKIESIEKEFGSLNLIESDALLRLRYIEYMLSSLPKIRELVFGNVKEIPNTDVELFKTEVPQDLYKMIMHENPSRSVDDANPVDSVNLDDVLRFCTRLSWLLAKEVDLPTRAEFKAGVGNLRYVDLNEVSWNNLNGSNKSHNVGTKKSNDNGFYDLLGNLAEITKPENRELIVLGGSSQSTTDALLDLAPMKFDNQQRSRMVGFRFVIRKADK